MKQIKPFQKKAYAAATPYDLEFSGRPVRKIGLRFDATVAGGPTSIRMDAAHRMLKTVEVNQAEQPLIRMFGQDWKHLSALINGGYDSNFQTTTLLVAQAVIDLEKLMPGACINASDKKVFIRGEFAPLADYSSGTAPSSITGEFKPNAESSEIDVSQGFLRPKITQSSFAISNAADLQLPIRFEQDIVVQGVMIRAVQASAAAQANTDGLVKGVRLDATTRDGGNIELHRGTWGQFRTATQEAANFNLEDYARAAGVIFLPTQSKQNPQFNGALLFAAGDSLTLHFDGDGTAEAEFTNVAPSAGDVVIVTVVGFTPVRGTGDAAAQVTDLKGGLYEDPRAERIRRNTLQKRLGLLNGAV